MLTPWTPLRSTRDELPGPWLHVLYGQVQDAEQERILEPDTKLDPRHLNSLDQYLEATSPVVYPGVGLTFANLSLSAADERPGHGAVALVLAVRSLGKGLRDHAGRPNLLFKQALVSVNSQLDSDTLADAMRAMVSQAIGPAHLRLRVRDNRKAGPIDDWYTEFYRSARQQPEEMRTQTVAYLKKQVWPDLNSAQPRYWYVGTRSSGRNVYVKYPHEWHYQEIIEFASALVAELHMTRTIDFPWSVVEIGNSLYDPRDTIAIRLVPDNERPVNEPGDSLDIGMYQPIPSDIAERHLWMQDIIQRQFRLVLQSPQGTTLNIPQPTQEVQIPPAVSYLRSGTLALESADHLAETKAIELPPEVRQKLADDDDDTVIKDAARLPSKAMPDLPEYTDFRDFPTLNPQMGMAQTGSANPFQCLHGNARAASSLASANRQVEPLSATEVNAREVHGLAGDGREAILTSPALAPPKFDQQRASGALAMLPDHQIMSVPLGIITHAPPRLEPGATAPAQLTAETKHMKVRLRQILWTAIAAVTLSIATLGGSAYVLSSLAHVRSSQSAADVVPIPAEINKLQVEVNKLQAKIVKLQADMDNVTQAARSERKTLPADSTTPKDDSQPKRLPVKKDTPTKEADKMEGGLPPITG